MSKAKKTVPASLVWFEIPADDMNRAKSFYHTLFGWKISAFPGMQDYWHIDTGGPDGLSGRRNDETHAAGTNDQQLHHGSVGDKIRCEGREARRKSVRPEDRSGWYGLFCPLPGYGKQHFRFVGSETENEIISSATSRQLM
jgi:hypothetical protein